MNIKHRIIAALVAIVAIVLGALWLVRACSQTEVGLDVTSPLAHAMDFSLLEEESGRSGGLAYDGGDGEDTLASHA